MDNFYSNEYSSTKITFLDRAKNNPILPLFMLLWWGIIGIAMASEFIPAVKEKTDQLLSKVPNNIFMIGFLIIAVLLLLFIIVFNIIYLKPLYTFAFSMGIIGLLLILFILHFGITASVFLAPLILLIDLVKIMTHNPIVW